MNKLKFLAISLVALLAMGGAAMAYDNPTYDTYSEKRNAGGAQSSPVRVLKLVRNASRDCTASGWISTTGILSGDAVKYDTVSDDGVTVALSAALSGDAAFAGIAATLIPTSDSAAASAFEDVGKRNWGWIVVHGPAVANVGAGGTNGNSVNDPFIMSNEARRITARTVTGGATSNDAKQKQGGFFFDAGDGSATTMEVFVQAE